MMRGFRNREIEYTTNLACSVPLSFTDISRYSRRIQLQLLHNLASSGPAGANCRPERHYAITICVAWTQRDVGGKLRYRQNCGCVRSQYRVGILRRFPLVRIVANRYNNLFTVYSVH